MDLDNKMTGKSIGYVDKDAQSFRKERLADKQLRLMELEDYIDANGTNHRQMKRLIITGSKQPYKNKLIRIRIEFDDDYPKSPLKLFVEKTNGVSFLHANVYQDLGDICHPLLQYKQGSKGNKFTYVLKKISELLYCPNFNNPANMTLSIEKTKDPNAYYSKIEQNASYLDDGQYLSADSSDSSDSEDNK